MVGAVGFIVDGGLLMLLHHGLGLGLLGARLVSFSVAVTVTWYLNRQHTFQHRKTDEPAQEWGRYAVANSLGALINLGLFFVLIHYFALLAQWPILPFAIASMVFGSALMMFAT